MTGILVVDDEPSLTQSIAYAFRKEGYEVATVGDGLDALSAAREQQPDVVVLDVMLPGIDGLEVCRRLRRTSAVPILMLTARGEEIDRIVGLEVGADDYLPKPFSMRELLARVRALLRRYELIREELTTGTDATDGDVLDGGDLRVDIGTHRVTRRGAVVDLTPKEFDLLAALIRHRGRVLPPGRLLQLVWGYTDADTRTVTVHIRNLRSKLEEDPSEPTLIETVRGVGYRYAR
ncbi:MAG: response regulator [Chloroflexi bacterium]|nr:response regulator [Chloroflexota bacterium]